MNRRNLIDVFATAFRGWGADSIAVRAAALTFFIILPLPSLLLIVIAIFALFYGPTQALQLLIQQISSVSGPAVAQLFRTLLQSATSPFSSPWTAFTVVIFSVGGAIGAFSVLRDTIDAIWKYRALRNRKLSSRIKRWVGPFLLISSLGLIVIASTAISTSLFDLIRKYSISRMLTFISLTAAGIFFSFIVSTLLFAIIYKFLPEARVHWQDVVLAAAVAGLAFTVTNYIIGTYIDTFTVTTVIGTAGSLFIILLWIYILNQIVLFGAEVSRAYAVTLGSQRNQPSLQTTRP